MFNQSFYGKEAVETGNDPQEALLNNLFGILDDTQRGGMDLSACFAETAPYFMKQASEASFLKAGMFSSALKGQAQNATPTARL